MTKLTFGFGGLALTLCLVLQVGTAAQPPDHARVIEKYCVTCHNERVKTANLMLDKADVAQPGAHAGGMGEGVRKCGRAPCRRPTCRSRLPKTGAH